MEDSFIENKKYKLSKFLPLIISLVLRYTKKIIGPILVILYYMLINIHLYYFINYFIFKVAFERFSTPIAILVTILGIYLLCRNIILYSLCLMWSPRTVKEAKKLKINFEKLREIELKEYFNISENDKNLLKQMKSDYKSLEKELKQSSNDEENDMMCKKCDYIKPLRTHHCSTCDKCVIRLDHHCIWINHCIGLDNHRFFVQLIFHSSLSSFFTLFCLYHCSNYNFYEELLVPPFLLKLLHIFLGVGFGIYTLFHLLIIYKDVTTIELLNLSQWKPQFKYRSKSFTTNLYLIFGTPNIFKALTFPLLDIIPLSGFEYEHEFLQGRTEDLMSKLDLFSLHKHDD